MRKGGWLPSTGPGDECVAALLEVRPGRARLTVRGGNAPTEFK
jgi:hypothetical protein